MPPDEGLGNGIGAGGSTGFGEVTTGLGATIGAAGTVTTTTRGAPTRSCSGTATGIGADVGAAAGSEVANSSKARLPTTASAAAARTAASPLTIHPDFDGEATGTVGDVTLTAGPAQGWVVVMRVGVVAADGGCVVRGHRGLRLVGAAPWAVFTN